MLFSSAEFRKELNPDDITELRHYPLVLLHFVLDKRSLKFLMWYSRTFPESLSSLGKWSLGSEGSSKH